MSETKPDTSTNNLPAILKVGVLVGVLAVLVVPVYLLDNSYVAGADWFFDTDTYMRMVRVQEWIGAMSADANYKSWYDNVSHSSNWPYGQTLHWTRPLDIILAAGGLLLSPITGMERGLYYFAVAISPILAILSILILFRASKSFLDVRGQISMAILLMIAPITKNYFYVARPDHHSLLIFLFVVVYAQLIIMFCENQHSESEIAEKKYPLIAGAFSAIALWTSVEALVTAAFAAMAIGVVWFVWGQNKNLERLRFYLWGLAITSVGAIAIERPPEQWIASVEYDRLSAPHVTLFLLLAFCGEFIWRAGKNYLTSHIKRFIGGTTLAVIPMIIIALLFPDFFKGPFAGAMDARLQDVWLGKIQEIRPLYDGDTQSLLQTIMHLGPLLWIAWWLKDAIKEENYSKNDQPSLYLILIIVVGLIVFVSLSVYQTRWAAYLGVICAVPLAALAQKLFDFNSGPTVGPPPGTPIFRVPVSASVFVAPGLLALLLVNLLPFDEEKTDAANGETNACRWSEIAPMIKSISEESGRKINIMTAIHEGPEVLYRTGQNVVGTPHHRNTEGILDSFKFFTNENTEQSFSILSKRNIDYLIFCRHSTEEKIYLQSKGETVIKMIVEERPPKWLVPITQPSMTGSGFHVFRFNEDAGF